MKRNPMIHDLKILPKYYNEVISLNKHFELRKDDRDMDDEKGEKDE